MKKVLKKVISSIVIGLLVLILIVAALIHFFGDAALKAGVETGASKAMKVDVTVRDISLKILAGKLNINDLIVNNPEGYQSPTFLEMGNGFVDLNTPSLLSDTVEIDTLQLNKVHLTIEQKGSTSNLNEILNNLPKSEKPAEVTEPAEKKPGKGLLIKQMDLKEITVTVKLLPVTGRADNLSLTLDPIHMENVGSGENIDTSQLVSTIITAIAKGVTKKGDGVLPAEMLSGITSELSQQGMKWLEGDKSMTEEATEALKSLNLFQKKEENEAEE